MNPNSTCGRGSAGRGCRQRSSKGNRTPTRRGTRTSPCHALGPGVFSWSPRRRISPCRTFPGEATGGRAAHRVSYSPASAEGTEVLAGSALSSAEPGPGLALTISLSAGSAGSPSRATSGVPGWRPGTGALPRQWLGAREAAGFCCSRKGAPGPSTGRFLLKAAGQLPGPAPLLPFHLQPASWASRPFLLRAHGRQR